MERNVEVTAPCVREENSEAERIKGRGERKKKRAYE